jgi:hypothetical protein
MNYRRNYKTDNVLPGQGYHIPHGPVTQEFLMVEWQLAWDNHSLWAEIWNQDLHTKDWSGIYSEIKCETQF